MKRTAPGSFGARLKELREGAGFTQEELATIAGISVHAVSSLERGERRRPQLDTLRALASALDLDGAAHHALLETLKSPSRAGWGQDTPGASLPMPPTSLLGRDAELHALSALIAAPGPRLITLLGPGGVGKTRLALEITTAIAAQGAVRVVFVGLAPVAHSTFVASTIAEACGLSDVSASDLPARLRLVCGEHPMLLVLDNFEHVTEAAPLVAQILSAVASLRILVTSRASLHVRGEREFLVSPLTVEETDAAAAAGTRHGPAVDLFVERVRDVEPDFMLTAANRSVIAAICRRLDALPLALELASPWIKVLAPEVLLRRLEQDALGSSIRARDLPERQQTMNATVAWSYRLLSGEEQRAFRRFGALPGLFPIDAAVAVLAGSEPADRSDAALSAIASLIDKSLLVRAQPSVIPTCQLYRMLETVRAYAAIELAASGERDEAMEGVVRYCSSEARLAADGLVGCDQVEWLDRVREDLESHRAALTWLIARGRSGEAATIACSLMFFWLIRGHAAEGLRWCDQILQLPVVTPVDRSRALLTSAALHYTQGDLQSAQAALDAAEPLAAATADVQALAQIDNFAGHVDLGLGKRGEARLLFARAAERFRILGLPWGVGNALAGGAWVTLTAGALGEAERLLDAAVPALAGAGPWFLLLTLYLRATLAIRRGEADTAILFVRESLSRIRELHDRFAFVYALVPLAAAAAMKGDDEWAARILGAREAISEGSGATVVDVSVDDLRDGTERGVRSRLGLKRWAAARAAGRDTSIDSLLAEIDRSLLHPGTTGV